MLVVNFHGVVMDESWDEPENFRPERYLDSNDNIVIPEKFFPFSIGIMSPSFFYKTAIIAHKYHNFNSK